MLYLYQKRGSFFFVLVPLYVSILLRIVIKRLCGSQSANLRTDIVHCNCFNNFIISVYHLWMILIRIEGTVETRSKARFSVIDGYVLMCEIQNDNAFRLFDLGFIWKSNFTDTD
jgi:hypothetical protein